MINYFFKQERHRPSKNIDFVWKVVWVLAVVKLLNRDISFLKNEHRPFVTIVVSIVRSWKYRNYIRETRRPVPSVHFISFDLDLMCSYIALQHFWVINIYKNAICNKRLSWPTHSDLLDLNHRWFQMRNTSVPKITALRRRNPDGNLARVRFPSGATSGKTPIGCWIFWYMIRMN